MLNWLKNLFRKTPKPPVEVRPLQSTADLRAKLAAAEGWMPAESLNEETCNQVGCPKHPFYPGSIPCDVHKEELHGPLAKYSVGNLVGK